MTVYLLVFAFYIPQKHSQQLVLMLIVLLLCELRKTSALKIIESGFISAIYLMNVHVQADPYMSFCTVYDWSLILLLIEKKTRQMITFSLTMSGRQKKQRCASYNFMKTS